MCRRVHRVAFTAALAATAGCTSVRSSALALNGDDPTPLASAPCASCVPTTLGSDVAQAVEKRLTELKAQGGPCSSYAAVLERSYRNGRIVIRPFMWRVGSQLTSGEATPNGDMILAREIDPLNVGVRTVGDLLWTLEHEAAHVAFKLGNGVTEDRANDYVRACK